MKLQIKTMIRIALSIALIAIGAQIKIPSPIAGYFTLQLPAVLITAILLGKKNGPLAVSIYLLGGLIGIPWFAAGGGIGYVLKPTFGFLLSFVAAAYIIALGRKKSFTVLLVYAFLATFSVWIIGMFYLTAINTIYLGKTGSYVSAFMAIFSIDLIFDFVLAYVSSIIGVRVLKAIGD